MRARRYGAANASSGRRAPTPAAISVARWLRPHAADEQHEAG